MGQVRAWKSVCGHLPRQWSYANFRVSLRSIKAGIRPESNHCYLLNAILISMNRLWCLLTGRKSFQGVELNGKTLGVVGCGRIGQVIKMVVIYVDKWLSCCWSIRIELYEWFLCARTVNYSDVFSFVLFWTFPSNPEETTSILLHTLFTCINCIKVVHYMWRHPQDCSIHFTSSSHYSPLCFTLCFAFLFITFFFFSFYFFTSFLLFLFLHFFFLHFFFLLFVFLVFAMLRWWHHVLRRWACTSSAMTLWWLRMLSRKWVTLWWSLEYLPFWYYSSTRECSSINISWINQSINQ